VQADSEVAIVSVRAVSQTFGSAASYTAEKFPNPFSSGTTVGVSYEAVATSAVGVFITGSRRTA